MKCISVVRLPYYVTRAGHLCCANNYAIREYTVGKNGHWIAGRILFFAPCSAKTDRSARGRRTAERLGLIGKDRPFLPGVRHGSYVNAWLNNQNQWCIQ